MTTTTATRKPATATSQPATSSSSGGTAPLQTSPDDRLVDMSSADETAQAAAVYEGIKAVPRVRPFNPPSSPVLIPERSDMSEATRSEIRDVNRARIADYNAQYEAYLRAFAAGIEQAPSLERVAAFGEPVGYDPLNRLPIRQRDAYADVLASPGVQQAARVHDARGKRMLEEQGIAAPGEVSAAASVELNLAGMHAGIDVDGERPTGERVGFSAGVTGNSHSANAALAKMMGHHQEESPAYQENTLIAGTSVNEHGDVSSTAGGKVAGIGGAATFNSKGEVEAVTLYARNVELGLSDEGFEGKIKAGGEVDVGGYDAELEGALTFGTSGEDIKLGLEGAAGLEGVAEVSGSARVTVGLVNARAARAALLDGGFGALMAQRAGGN